MKFLVTGGAGFIGSNLVQSLLDENREVICLDKNPDGNWSKGSLNYIGSINNVKLLEDIVSNHKIDTIFHMAAEASVQVSLSDPILTMRTNALGTNKVLDVAKRFGVRKFVMSSTCAVYDGNTSPYALSKNIAEQMCEYYSKDLSVNVLRYFNVYGKGHRVAGPYPPVVAIFIDRYNRNLPLEIVGTGEQRRDFVNVDDVVRANKMIADSDLGYGVYDVGSGVNHSVKQIANMISEDHVHIEERQGEVFSTLSSIEKIKNDLKWSPTISVEDWISEQIG